MFDKALYPTRKDIKVIAKLTKDVSTNLFNLYTHCLTSKIHLMQISCLVFICILTIITNIIFRNTQLSILNIFFVLILGITEGFLLYIIILLIDNITSHKKSIIKAIKIAHECKGGNSCI